MMHIDRLVITLVLIILCLGSVNAQITLKRTVIGTSGGAVYNNDGGIFVKQIVGQSSLIGAKVSNNLQLTQGFLQPTTNKTYNPQKNYSLTVYPNPTDGNITLFIPEFKEGESLEVQVYSLIGKILESHPIFQGINILKLENLAAGVYYLAIPTNKGLILSEKIVLK
jgi:hypothetical protein